MGGGIFRHCGVCGKDTEYFFNSGDNLHTDENGKQLAYDYKCSVCGNILRDADITRNEKITMSDSVGISVTKTITIKESEVDLIQTIENYFKFLPHGSQIRFEAVTYVLDTNVVKVHCIYNSPGGESGEVYFVIITDNGPLVVDALRDFSDYPVCILSNTEDGCKLVPKDVKFCDTCDRETNYAYNDDGDLTCVNCGNKRYRVTINGKTFYNSEHLGRWGDKNGC
ncbi:MAG: hypothetical protein MPK62_09210 [Alphaproteobacteria bacterium]|nr:hypothetical protein [Alphaproteobacteria bacterium]